MLKANKYIVYTKPYELNLVGIRNKDTNPIKFDDTFNVFWKDESGIWMGRQYASTTDPSTTYLKQGGIGNCEGEKCSAILPTGQYVDSWKIGYHKGKYKALVQAKPISIYRDLDRNAVLTFDTTKVTGNFGINIHKAKGGGADDGQGTTDNIGLYSAGCQVLANHYCFAELLSLIQKQQNIYGTKYFTYTLFDKWMQQKFFIKRLIYSSAIITGVGFIGYGVYLWTKNK